MKLISRCLSHRLVSRRKYLPSIKKMEAFSKVFCGFDYPFDTLNTDLDLRTACYVYDTLQWCLEEIATFPPVDMSAAAAAAAFVVVVFVCVRRR